MTIAMRKINRNIQVWGFLAVLLLSLNSCQEFLNPDQELHITEDQMFDDWYEYRSAEMGMYALQQQLVEQLFILGELRGDLVNITENATSDMIDVYNFNISNENEYASPTNFFKLIAATNNFISRLQNDHPEVLDKTKPINNYDRLYGEALCMRAWTYFNAVRIYEKVPFIPNSLESYEEINDFINSSGTYIDSVHITFPKDGYPNPEDTVYNVEFELEKQYYDLALVIDHFGGQLENDIKAIGVNHAIENNDLTWEVSMWNAWALHALLGQMYLTQGDLARANSHFEEIVYNSSEEYRYQLDETFRDGSWTDIFTGIDNREHIYTIWFNKANFQQNKFQEYFEVMGPHKYMMKPSKKAIDHWETEWRNQIISEDFAKPSESYMIFAGIPSDFYRGIGSSYLYARNGVAITEDEYMNMILLRAKEDDRSSRAIMEGMDTIIYKYSIEKDMYDQDANYCIFRAAGIHLYIAEIYAYWRSIFFEGLGPTTNTIVAEQFINDGTQYSYSSDREQLGIRGRVGLGENYDKIDIRTIVYIHDPYTNEIINYKDYSGNFESLKAWFEVKVMDERARELAFEGERFYDLLRVAERRGDVDGAKFLAETISQKYPAERRQEMYNHLLKRENWYIPYFDFE